MKNDDEQGNFWWASGPSERAALLAALIAGLVALVCIAGITKWSDHDRSVIERAADACSTACFRHGIGHVASFSATECRC